MQEVWFWSRGQKDSLEEEMAAWEIPLTEEPGRLQSIGSQRVRHNWTTKQEQVTEDPSQVPAFLQIMGLSAHVYM